MLTLITGGARSGKSTFAQSLCSQFKNIVYIAAALPSDEEMRTRICRHRRSRPPSWMVVEEPIQVAEAVRQHVTGADIVLVDCLTVWLANQFYEWRDEEPAVIERKALEEAHQLIEASKLGQVIAVTNEIGSGLVPETPVGRHFRDVQGFINQQVAGAAESVYLVVSGIPLRIKPGPVSCVNGSVV